MRVHHLNCISSCPIGGMLMDGRSRGLYARLVCHCLLVELGDRLVLVDTGYGLRDIAEPRARLSKIVLAILRPELREEMTAIRQIQALGLDPHDVRDIVLTHLDWDHAGGLDDFPWATVHLMEAEREAAFAQETAIDRIRYRPQQWSTKASWVTYEPMAGDHWYGFECIRTMKGLGDEIAMVPLVGHTFGHAGVAVRRDRDWLLLAGDAYFYRRELEPRPRCTPGLRLYQTILEKDRRARLGNQRRLRALRAEHRGEVTIVSGHDPVEFERVAGRSSAVPVVARPAIPELAPPTEAGAPA